MSTPIAAPKPGAGVYADPERPINIIFVGAGAVGCFYASRLHHPDHNIHVSLLARSNYNAIIAANNTVTLQTHTFGDYLFHPVATYPNIATAAASRVKWDYVIVTTKALPDRQDDSKTIEPLLKDNPDACIILIQNGVGVEHPYRARFPRNPIVSGVTVISAEQIRPGVIRQNRWTRMHLGPYTDSAAFEVDAGTVTGQGKLGDEERRRLNELGMCHAKRLQDWWTRYGGIRDIKVTTEVGLQTVRWHKLTINAAFNPSAVLSGGRGNADMVLDAELRAHLKGVMDEIWAAAPKILGNPKGFVEVDKETGEEKEMARPEQILKSTERNVGSKPSMLLDWEAGRAMELEVILGNPVRIARAKGVELPRVQTLYALLKSAQERRNKKKGKL